MTDRMSRRLPLRLVGTGALALGLLAAGAGVACAHITVSAPDATRGGGDTVVTFRVPDESDSARTVGVKVRLPSDTPIASVMVQPKAGWTAAVTTTKLSAPIKTDDGDITDVVSEIDWKVSDGGRGIGPGQFDQFVLLAGQLPDTPALTFKVIQVYSDSSSVPWIEVPAPGSSAEPEHPAPVLTLAAGSSAAPNSAARAVGPADAASKATANTGLVLGGLGVLLGLAALVLSVRRRSRPVR